MSLADWLIFAAVTFAGQLLAAWVAVRLYRNVARGLRRQEIIDWDSPAMQRIRAERAREDADALREAAELMRMEAAKEAAQRCRSGESV